MRKAFGDLIEPDVTPEEFAEMTFARGLAEDEDHEFCEWVEESLRSPYSHFEWRRQRTPDHSPAWQTTYSTVARRFWDDDIWYEISWPNPSDLDSEFQTFPFTGLWEAWRDLPKKDKMDVKEPQKGGIFYITRNEREIVDRLLQRKIQVRISTGSPVPISLTRGSIPQTPLGRALFLIHIQTLRDLCLKVRDVLGSERPMKVMVLPEGFLDKEGFGTYSAGEQLVDRFQGRVLIDKLSELEWCSLSEVRSQKRIDPFVREFIADLPDRIDAYRADGFRIVAITVDTIVVRLGVPRLYESY